MTRPRFGQWIGEGRDARRYLGRPRSLHRRGSGVTAKPQTLVGRGVEGGKPRTLNTMGALKRDLMAQARRLGWRGKSFRTAKQFDRAVTRAERLAKGLV